MRDSEKERERERVLFMPLFSSRVSKGRTVTNWAFTTLSKVGHPSPFPLPPLAAWELNLLVQQIIVC